MGPAADGFFGFSVALSSTTAVIGAPLAPVRLAGPTFTSGREPHGGYRRPARRRGNDFGWSVAISGTRVLIGAPRESLNLCGTSCEYIRIGHTWVERAEILNPGCAIGDDFGNAVALSGRTAIIGAPGADKGNGAVYLNAVP